MLFPVPCFVFQMRLWAREDAIDFVDYALEKGIEQLDFFDAYFDTKFPLPKMGTIFEIKHHKILVLGL